MATIQWSYVENRLFLWFWRLTAMKEDRARAVFFSARSFQGRTDMLWAAMDESVRPNALKGPYLELFEALLKKAVSYSSTRNAIAHGFAVLLNRGNGELFHAMVAGKDRPLEYEATAKETAAIGTCAANFETLSRLTLIGLRAYRMKSEKRTRECLARVNMLPNEAYSEKPSQKQLQRERQRTLLPRKSPPAKSDGK